MIGSFKDIVLYVAIFASVYVQVFFLLIFLENKKFLEKKKENKNIINSSLYKTITLLVPCWNEEKTIANTVRSIKSLSYPQDKIFIFLINDGSSDRSWEVMQEFINDPYVRLFNKENGGKYSALNYGLKYVNTELVCSIDADTDLKNDALEKIVSFFIKRPEVDAVGGNVLIKKPKTIAQKAQSIEYQMFSFTKKMLAFLGGVLVVPGAFSVFKTKVINEVGGWGAGHNLEDLELTYRLQTKGYKVEHSNEATAITSGPVSVKKLFKQRLRWGYGFLNNTYDYRFAFFKKKFGNFGFFTLPMSLMSYVIIMVIFFISWYNIALFLYNKFLIWKLIGFGALFTKLSISSFYINTKAIVFLSIIAIAFLIINIILGRKISNVKEKNITHIFYFFVLYSLIVPFWVLKSILNTINKARPSWR